MSREKTDWDKLSMQERSELMKIYIRGGMYDLKEIVNHYNNFDVNSVSDPIEEKRAKGIPTTLEERLELDRQRIAERERRRQFNYGGRLYNDGI